MSDSQRSPALAAAERPLLWVFAGRPGTGKTTIARKMCRRSGACYLRVDAVEAALLGGGSPVGPPGYAVVHELAVSNLLIGTSVVVDAVNAVPEARAGWREAARRGHARLALVEVSLTNAAEHRRRVEQRMPDLPGHQGPSWEEVVSRQWATWERAPRRASAPRRRASTRMPLPRSSWRRSTILTTGPHSGGRYRHRRRAARPVRPR